MNQQPPVKEFNCLYCDQKTIGRGICETCMYDEAWLPLIPCEDPDHKQCYYQTCCECEETPGELCATDAMNIYEWENRGCNF